MPPKQAGYKNIVLLEEPQAAFYAWIERAPELARAGQRRRSDPGVDIGGGTTDFTLIAVTEEGGELRLERVAVGEHILLGGDNMDLALARTVEAQLAEKNTKLDAMQLNALVAAMPRREREDARARIERRSYAGHDSGSRYGIGRRHDQERS